MPLYVEVIETASLGNRGYIVHDGRTAFALDVQRDYGRWIDAADEAGVTITHVIETHMHNDYVTGGYRLALEVGAEYIVPAESGITFDARELHDGETVRVGDLQVTGYHTPGHTEHHMSYMAETGEKRAVFTSGGILYGTVGRTDLVAPEKTQGLTEAQYDSAQRLANELPGETGVFPTHGFGSFCSSSAGTGASESTLEQERNLNIAFTTTKDEFVRQIIEGLGPYPRYYAHMGSINQQGPGPVEALRFHDYSVEEMARELTAPGTWVIDVRSRTLFAAGHPEGALGIELGGSFATYVGWLVPWSEKILLVGDTKEELYEAHTELSRIGMDRFVEGATDTLTDYLDATRTSSYAVKTFSDLTREQPAPYVLDVRQRTEWEAGHVASSLNIPLHELMARMSEVPTDREVWVHCASGYRASIAASLLDRAGRTPVHINDNYEAAESLGLSAE